MNNTAPKLDSIASVDFVEIDSRDNVLLSHGGSEGLFNNAIKVRSKLKELGITDENLGVSEDITLGMSPSQRSLVEGFASAIRRGEEEAVNFVLQQSALVEALKADSLKDVPSEAMAIWRLVESVRRQAFRAEMRDDELARPEKPRWAERTTGRDVTPVDWIKMHYGRWVNGEWDRDGLTQADLSRADRKLYDAYIARIRRLPNEELGLPVEPRSPVADPEKVLDMKRKANRAYMRRQSRQPTA